VLGKWGHELERLAGELGESVVELGELRDENAELNEHIFSIDVFMREKEQQCEQSQREKEELSEQLRQKTSRLESLERSGSDQAGN